MSRQYSWANLGDKDNPEWGVKVSGNIGEAMGLSGTDVEVQSRSGRWAAVKLGALRTSWNGGRAGIYEVVRKPRRGDAEGERQHDEKRSDKTYGVVVMVMDGTTILKQWTTTVHAKDPDLWRETGVDVVRTAIGHKGLLDTDGEPPAPARPSRSRPKATARKTTTKKGA